MMQSTNGKFDVWWRAASRKICIRLWRVTKCSEFGGGKRVYCLGNSVSGPSLKTPPFQTDANVVRLILVARCLNKNLATSFAECMKLSTGADTSFGRRRPSLATMNDIVPPLLKCIDFLLPDGQGQCPARRMLPKFLLTRIGSGGSR